MWGQIGWWLVELSGSTLNMHDTCFFCSFTLILPMTLYCLLYLVLLLAINMYWCIEIVTYCQCCQTGHRRVWRDYPGLMNAICHVLGSGLREDAGDSDDNTETTFPRVYGSSRLYCTMVVWYYGSVESITRSTAEWVQWLQCRGQLTVTRHLNNSFRMKLLGNVQFSTHATGDPFIHCFMVMTMTMTQFCILWSILQL